MYAIVIVNSVILMLLAKFCIKNRVSRNLFLIYLSYWSLSLFVSSINVVKLFMVDDDSYYLLIGHLYAFLFGYLIINQNSCYKAKKTEINVLSIQRSYLFWFLFVICFIVVVNLFRKQSELLLLYSLTEIRSDFWEIVLEGNGFVFFTTIVHGMFHFCLSMSFYMLFFDRRWIIILILLAFTILFAFLGGGRNQFATFIFYLINIYLMKDFIYSSKTKEICKYLVPLKMKIIACVFVVLSVFVMSLFSALRSNENAEIDNKSLTDGFTELTDVLIEYSLGPIVAFDRGLKMKKFQNKHYGMATIDGTELVASRILIGKIIPKYKPAYSDVTYPMQNNLILVASDRSWNYAYTSCFYYYCDFGYLGVFLIPFILGIMFRYIIIVLENKLSIFSIAAFLFVGYCLYNSVFTCYLHKNFSIVYILLMIILNHGVGSKMRRKMQVTMN